MANGEAKNRIAVIGAGVTGSAVARRLADKGHRVTVFDKGRDLGGRLATRTSRQGFAFDHGAPYVHADRAPFRSVLEKLSGHGSATDPGGDARPVYGLPAMNALFAPFFADLEVVQSAEVTGIIQGADGWTLAIKDHPPALGFDSIAITVPADQAIPLIIPFGTGWENALSAVSYAPCLTAMVAFESRLPLADDAEPATAFAISKQIRNSAKPGRPNANDHWVIHADRAYSEANLDREKDEIADDLFARFLSANGLPQLKPTYLAGHRWRFARVDKPLGYSHLWEADLGIGLAGDWCLGPNAEHAFESGVMLAEAIDVSLSS